MAFLAVAGMAALIAGLAETSAAVEPGDAVDLLARPMGAAGGWRHFSEAPGTGLSEIWTFTNGVLSCRGAPRGYLTFNRDLADFDLSLEWRRQAGEKPGRAGVLIRTTGPDRIWPRSLEAQLNAGQAGDFWGLGGFALDGPAERKTVVDKPQQGRLTHLKRTADPEKPVGEWNRYEISARGDVVSLRINGVEVNRATGCDTNAGRICLTAEGDPIEFRNVRLRAAGDAPGLAPRVSSVTAPAERPADLARIRRDALAYAGRLRVPGGPAGAFFDRPGKTHAPSLYASCDVVHLRTVMGEDLRATLSEADRRAWIDHINSFARPDGTYGPSRQGHSPHHANGMVVGALGVLGGRQLHPVRLYEDFDAVGAFGLLQQVLPDEYPDTVRWTDIFSDRRLYLTSDVEAPPPATAAAPAGVPAAPARPNVVVLLTDRWRLVNDRELCGIAADPGQQRDPAAAFTDKTRARGDPS